MLRFSAIIFGSLLTALAADLPHKTPDGYALPNGWRITPIGKAIVTEDMVLNLSLAPDAKAAIAMNSGFNPHSLVVIDTNTQQMVQHIRLKSTWLGLAWARDGKRLYVSGAARTPDPKCFSYPSCRKIHFSAIPSMSWVSPCCPEGGVERP